MITEYIQTCDIANYVKHICCIYYGWTCPSRNREVCISMINISLNMILDHLY